MRHFGSKGGRAGSQNSVDEDDPNASASPPDIDSKQNVGTGALEDEEEEEEDDYMNMTFDDAPSKQPETSLQRSQRLRKEGLKRGIVPSKAELAAQERQRREEGLSRSLITGAAAGNDKNADNDEYDDRAAAEAKKKKPQSKGLAMMARMGFTPGSALGSRENASTARSEPLRIETKDDRGGIGADAEKKRKLAEAADAAGLAKRARVEELGDYRGRMARERDAARKEKLVFAAQKIAEKMDEDGGGGGALDAAPSATAAAAAAAGGAKKTSSRPLKSIPVVYRGLMRRRDEAERDRRMRYDLEQSSGGLSAKLPAYEDEGMDEDDRMALGGRTEKKTIYMPADDLDEEDPELEDFSALEVGEQLLKLVAYLRERHRYCFWCKFAYPDEEMDGCPGLTEEDHD
ncbi:hypothetical protein Daus18300_005136 [Diaporthe australafricana]|uniref:G-patch domain-containing protein n=1 Tax=Diaporthe australafricana TaxID=127596 RepID=A0ABR3X445_9PEZI